MSKVIMQQNFSKIEKNLIARNDDNTGLNAISVSVICLNLLENIIVNSIVMSFVAGTWPSCILLNTICLAKGQ